MDKENKLVTGSDLQALIAKETLAAETDASDKKTEFNRRKAAKEWVQHYVYISEFKAELIADGLDPELFTADNAAQLLFERWNDKAVVRGSKAI